MSRFQEMVAKDIDSVFFNLDEFAEMHEVDGASIPVVMGTDKHIQLGSGSSLGLVSSDLVVYIKVTDLPKRKSYGSHLRIDKREYIVDDWQEDMGVWAISLSQTASRR